MPETGSWLSRTVNTSFSWKRVATTASHEKEFESHPRWLFAHLNAHDGVPMIAKQVVITILTNGDSNRPLLTLCHVLAWWLHHIVSQNRHTKALGSTVTLLFARSCLMLLEVKYWKGESPRLQSPQSGNREKNKQINIHTRRYGDGFRHRCDCEGLVQVQIIIAL